MPTRSESLWIASLSPESLAPRFSALNTLRLLLPANDKRRALRNGSEKVAAAERLLLTG
jgi:hypothetical protein